MTIWQAIILGLVQGITEFLPVSSSGHLVVARALLGAEAEPLIFEIVVHCGTCLLYTSRIEKITKRVKFNGPYSSIKEKCIGTRILH